MPNQQLANELINQLLGSFKKEKVRSCFKDNIWGVDLADIQLISKCNKGIRYSFSKYANKIWTDQGSEFYKTHFKKWLKDNNIEMYSTRNEGPFVVAGRFIRTLKNKICKHMTANSKSIYF